MVESHFEGIKEPKEDYLINRIAFAFGIKSKLAQFKKCFEQEENAFYYFFLINKTL